MCKLSFNSKRLCILYAYNFILYLANEGKQGNGSKLEGIHSSLMMLLFAHSYGLLFSAQLRLRLRYVGICVSA